MNLQNIEPNHQLTTVPRRKRDWRTVALLLLACFAPNFRAAAALCTPAPGGLRAWWPAEGDATDLAGTNNGVLQGGATATGLGMVGSAFSFDGTNAYIQFPDSPVFHPANLTIEGWVRFSGLDSAGDSQVGQQYIVFKQNTRSGIFEGFAVTKSRSSGRDYFDFQVSSSTGQAAEIISATAITSNVWYHVACVRGADVIQIYVNGQLENQTAVGFAQDYGNLPLFLGSSGVPGWDRKFKGMLDELSLYNRPLASNEIAAIYGAGAAGKCKADSPPGIDTQPQTQTVPVGANVSFKIVVSGTPPLSYQWQRNGEVLADSGNVSGSASNVLSLANVQTNDSAGFQVVVTNASGAVTSAVAMLTVDLTLRAPNITSQPVSQSVHPGTNIVFTVIAEGSTPLGYQWQFNGAGLSDGGQFSGVSSSALSISYVLPGNAGSYAVVVTNLAGAATGTVATLTVTPGTDCLARPAGLVGWWPGDGSARDIVGTNHGTFYGGANANAPGFNGSAFHFDGTNDYIQFPDSPVFHPTNLSVEVWVNFDAYQTPGDTFYPYQQYIVFKQNSRQFEFEGFGLTKDHDPQGDVFLWEVASVNGELMRIDSVNTVVTGAWYHVVGVRGPDYAQLWMNGHLEVQTNVSFAQDYGTTPLYFGTSGQSYYDRRLHGTLDEVSLYNRALSSNEIVSLYLAGSAGKCKGTNGLFIAAQPQDLALPAGSNALFTVGAVGISPMSYQWQYNGVSLPDATGSNLFLADVKTSNAGSYSVVVANPAASVVSASAFLTVLAVPDITTQPSNQTVVAGSTVNFSVGASGATLSYQWRLNGAPIAGATGTTLTLTNAQPPDAGDYSAVITNYAGSVTSAVGTLIVLVPPGVTLQPVSQTVPVGATVSFSVAAEGTIPLNYQWQFNGTTLESALSPGLLLTNVQVAQAGVYLAEISNAAGTTNSAAALLKVIDQPLLLNARMTNGAFGFTLSGIEGQIYVIDVSTNLPDWTPLTTLSNSAALTDFVDFTSSNSVSRFYRARWAQ